MCIRDRYGKTTIRVKPNQTALVEDLDLSKKLLTVQPNIVELYTEPSFDELKGHLSSFLNPNGEEEVATEKKEPEMVSAQASSNVEDDFDKLFNS